MNPLLPYLLKMLLCSGLLYGYYRLALRNRVFHQWNRFYLLAIPPLSLLLPLVRISFEKPAPTAKALPVRMLEVVGGGNEFMDAVRLPHPKAFDWTLLVYAAYVLLAFLLLLRFFIGVQRLRKLSKQYPAQELDGVTVVLAPVPGTPFSWFRRIFWNPSLSPESDTGRQVLEHELVHVREGHSLDKVCLQLTLALCWFNPFFWLIRNELHLIHEFIADERSVRNQDAGTLAKLILEAAYPQRFGRLTNPFFHHAIKRRLYMLTKLRTARARYIGRLLALPLLACIGLTFAARVKAQTQHLQTPKTSQPFTVVIDAGHGRLPNGNWSGAQAAGLSEDEITLAIARKMLALNQDPQLKLVLTRSADANTDLKGRAVMARQAGGQLFLSLHMNADDAGHKAAIGTQQGFSVVLSRNDSTFEQSRLFGSALVQSLSGLYNTSKKLEQAKRGVWVLDQSPCPAALVEMGYITNAKDRGFMKDSKNQGRVAVELLAAIAQYRHYVKQGETGYTPAGKTLSISSRHKENLPARADSLPALAFQRKMESLAALLLSKESSDNASQK